MREIQSCDEILGCPRCDRSPLQRADDGLHCSGCQTRFPVFDGIPWLFAEPAAAVAEWRQRLGMVVAKREDDAKAIEKRLTGRDLSSNVMLTF